MKNTNFRRTNLRGRRVPMMGAFKSSIRAAQPSTRKLFRAKSFRDRLFASVNTRNDCRRVPWASRTIRPMGRARKCVENLILSCTKPIPRRARLRQSVFAHARRMDARFSSTSPCTTQISIQSMPQTSVSAMRPRLDRGLILLGFPIRVRLPKPTIFLQYSLQLDCFS